MMKLLALSLCLAAASATTLTPDNVDEMTAGKTVFIKFLAPWCGHCKSMKPAWDKLMGDFDGHKSALVADVDCTAEGKPLCDSNGVQGFPTIKWGQYAAMENYEGGRSYDDLKKFADENLKPSCGPSNLDLCDDDKKAEIEKLMALSDDDIASQIEEGEQKIKEADDTFEAEVKKLQTKYESLQKEKEDTVAEVKKSGLGLMKSVKAAKATAAKEEL